MKYLSLALLFGLVSCAGMKENVRGYSGAKRNQAMQSIIGKTPAEAKAILGEPVAEGLCLNQCNYEKGVHQMVYLMEDMPRYSYALSMANKSELKCFIIDFRYNQEMDKHVYDGSFMDQASCSQDYGAIARVRKLD